MKIPAKTPKAFKSPRSIRHAKSSEPKAGLSADSKSKDIAQDDSFLASPQASGRMARSSQDLVALDLAASGATVIVTPESSFGRASSPQIEDLVIPVRRTARDTLEDASGRVYPIGPSIKQGGNGGIRFLLAPDKVVSQLYIVKEVPRGLAPEILVKPSPPKLRLQIPPHRNLPLETMTPEMHRPTTEGERREAERINDREVNSAHEIHSPFAAHAVLRSPDTDYHLLPAGDGDMHEVWNSIYETPPAARKELVIACFRQLATSLHQIHERGFAHRDIKLGNVFFRRSGQFYFGDFGLLLPTQEKDGRIGTPEYQPLEVFFDPAHDTQKADVAALAYCIMALLTNTSLYWPEVREINFLKLSDPSCPVAERASLSKALEGLIRDTQMSSASLAQKAGRPTAGGPRLSGRAREMKHKWQMVKDRAPEIYPLLRKMTHVNPPERPSASEVVRLIERGPLGRVIIDEDKLKKLLEGVPTNVQEHLKQEVPEMVSAKKSPDRLPTRMRRSHSFTVKPGLN